MDVPLVHRMLMSCIDKRAVQDVALSCQGGRRLYVVSITVSLTLTYPAPKMKQTRHRHFPRCRDGQALVRLISSTIPEHLYSQQTARKSSHAGALSFESGYQVALLHHYLRC